MTVIHAVPQPVLNDVYGGIGGWEPDTVTLCGRRPGEVTGWAVQHDLVTCPDCQTSDDFTDTGSLKMVAGGLYRNPCGAELHLIEPGHVAVLGSRLGGFRESLGEIWTGEFRDDLFDTVDRCLVTAAGLEERGYSLVTESEVSS